MNLNLRKLTLIRYVFLMVFLWGCATSLPEPKHDHYLYPSKSVYLNLPTGDDAARPYEVMGWVRSKAVYSTMEEMGTNQSLCRNYYNKAAQSLLKEAKKVKADAVIQVRSVVMLLDGKIEEHETPECSDDGASGEILLRGVAIRFKPLPSPTPPSTPVPSVSKE